LLVRMIVRMIVYVIDCGCAHLKLLVY